MRSLIQRTLRPVLHNASRSDVLLLNGADHTILTRTSWPFLYSTLYEIVVRPHGELALYAAEGTTDLATSS